MKCSVSERCKCSRGNFWLGGVSTKVYTCERWAGDDDLRYQLPRRQKVELLFVGWMIITAHVVNGFVQALIRARGDYDWWNIVFCVSQLMQSAFTCMSSLSDFNVVDCLSQ